MSSRAALSAAVVMLAVVVGCSEEDPPASLPSPTSPSSASSSAPETTTTAPSTSATPTGAPTVPAAAQEQTPDGAAAFVQHYYETLEYSWSVMDSSPLRALGDCLSCANLAGTIDEVAAAGDHLEGGNIVVKSVEPSSVSADGATTVNSLVSSAEQRIVGPDGVTQEVLGQEQPDLQFFFDLTWTNGGWAVTSIRIIE
ncbi:MAG: hypothetical protein H0V32_05820 [Nocardioidaceae bacterium]|nr:hypothetical protein [Nocardioidaceae bacterium]